MSVGQSTSKSKELLRNNRVSIGWWRHFIERQEGKLVFQRGNSTIFVCIDAVNEETLKQY